MDTPYQWTKQIASHWGGTRNGTIVHWPAGIRAKGEVRAQFHHVIDIAPTILDVAGLPHPLSVNGVQQMPLHGVSMRYAFDDADAADRHETQYFETFVNRGIYHRGWTACTRHSTPWISQQLPALDDDVWELYGPDDWTQAHDLAAEQPDKLRELQRLFLIEAGKYNVLPLDDRRYERFNAELAGRPQLVTGTSQLLFAGMGRLSENSIIVLKNKSMSITASITVPDGGANGVLLAQGGAFGGLSLYLHDGRPAYCYNLYGIERIKIYGDDPVPAGDHQVRAEFTYDGGGLAKGGDLALYVDGTKVGEGRIDATVPDDLLRRRDHRRRHRRRHPGQRRLRPEDRSLHRPRPLGPARHRQRQTSTTSSAPTNASASPWPGSSGTHPAVQVVQVVGLHDDVRLTCAFARRVRP